MERDTVGRWSHDKLELLRKYLEAYTAVLAAQPWLRNGYHYIDGFAGGGRPWSREEQRFIDGSPRVALQISRPFTTYRFIEQKPWRVAQLEQLRAEFPERSIHIDQGDCNHILLESVARDIRYERYSRGLVFLDPFTMNLEWATVAALAETKALEVFINFPAMALNRTVLVGDLDRVRAERIERMNRFWGSDTWLPSVYDKRPTLFGDERFVKRPQAGKALGQLYRARLHEIFPCVSEPVVMTNSNNAPLYHLIFAGHNPTGLSIITDIFGRFERLAC